MVEIGEGVFETLRVVDSQPHAFTRHFERMAQGAKRLGMPLPIIDTVLNSLRAHLTENPVPFGRLRLTWAITPTGAALSIASEPTPPPASAVSLRTDDWRIDEHGPRAGIKSTRYEGFAAARLRAQAQGYDDALLANTADLLCETSTANIFYARDGVLFTPSPVTGCLPGIARGLVLQRSAAHEIAASPTLLRNADEIFITSSLRGVQPVHQIDDRTYSWPGPLTTAAAKSWAELFAETLDPLP